MRRRPPRVRLESLDMIDFDDALSRCTALARPLGAEPLGMDEAAGRILAAPIVARSESPAAPTSSMDGYAVRDADVRGPSSLRVIGASYPGQPFAGPIASGECVRIFTGAALPAGADRVVIQEVVRAASDRAELDGPAQGFDYVRARGSDFAAGEILLEAGMALTAQRMVAAAAADAETVAVFRRPRVAIIANGDELAPAGSAHLRPGAIPDTATPGVAALAEAWGAEVASRDLVGDDIGALRAAGARALAAADVVVVIGGASVGERDFARAMLEGARPVFSKARIKPGKPVWLSTLDGRIILGLPGNPTSALVTARLFLAPLLAGLAGGDPRAALVWRDATLAGPLAATDDRETFHRAQATPEGAFPLPDQSSGAQKALAQADLLIRRPPMAAAAKAGETVTALDL
jgi:molybdopterin molybdotransferase